LVGSSSITDLSETNCSIPDAVVLRNPPIYADHQLTRRATAADTSMPLAALFTSKLNATCIIGVIVVGSEGLWRAMTYPPPTGLETAS
jgi:hypothetical protein